MVSGRTETTSPDDQKSFQSASVADLTPFLFGPEVAADRCVPIPAVDTGSGPLAGDFVIAGVTKYADGGGTLAAMFPENLRPVTCRSRSCTAVCKATDWA